jgi:hypothetical protein
MKLPVRSTLAQQIPAFVVEEKPLFVAFLDAYYEWLERDGYSVDYIRNALSFLDVDRTLDRFVNQFWEEVKDIPLDARADRRLLAKHIYDLYQAKGTIKSYELLFRILYGEDVEIYTPKLDMLRVSDGKWEVDYVIRCTAVSGDPFGLIGLSLHQDDPSTSLLVQNVIKQTYGAMDYYDIYVEPLSVDGTFRYGETAYGHWTDENNDQQTITVMLPPAPATMEVRVKGAYYDAGANVYLYDAMGQNFVARVSEIGLGRVDDVLILDGGSGYAVGDLLSVDNTGTGGSNLKVAVAAVDAGVITKVNVVNPGLAYSTLPVITGAHGGTFLAISTTIGRVLDVVTSDLGHDHTVQLTETNLRTKGIITDPVGTFTSGESITLLDECLLTENYFSLLNEDGTRILNEEQVSQTTAATVFKVINNTIQLDGQVTRRAIGIEGESGVFLTEDGGVMVNELSSADLVRRTLQGVTSSATCRVIDMHPASIVYETGTLATTSKRFASLDGKVSEATKRIQDSKFYQDFSYVIKSAQSTDTYKNIVQRLIHPAGLAMFGEVSSNTYVKIGLKVIDQFDHTVNLETFLAMGFAPAGTQYQLTQQVVFDDPISGSYYGIDRWKFDPSYSTSDNPYQSDTLIANFANTKFTDVYTYDSDDNVTGYVLNHTYLTRGSEIRVNGTLI